jgi:hypothetical protein
MVSSGLLRRVALVRTDVSEEPGASFIRVTKIGELGTTPAATINRRTLRRNTFLCSVPLQASIKITCQNAAKNFAEIIKNLYYIILIFVGEMELMLATLEN